MPVFDLFSKRQKRLRGEISDIFSYDEIPNPLRVQIANIIDDAIGSDRSDYGPKLVKDAYSNINKILCREYGVLSLTSREHRNSKGYIMDFLLNEKDVEKVIDIIELSFQIITHISTRLQEYQYHVEFNMTPSDAVEELNKRFAEHAIGYQFEEAHIIRVDSTYVHSEIVKPVLTLLSNHNFQGAFDEYYKAHEHYRNSRNKECLTDCLKAFESTMKTICDIKGWNYDPKDTASKLIKACMDNGLFPNFTETQLGSLKNLLEGGVPTLRNKYGGHGQGSSVQNVDIKLTRYCLNLTGTTIIFLIEQSNIL